MLFPIAVQLVSRYSRTSAFFVLLSPLTSMSPLPLASPASMPVAVHSCALHVRLPQSTLRNMSVTRICRRAYSSFAGYSVLGSRTLRRFASYPSVDHAAIFRVQRSASFHSTRLSCADDEKSSPPPDSASSEPPLSTDEPDEDEDEDDEEEESSAERLIKAFRAGRSADTTDAVTTTSDSSTSASSSSDELIFDYSQLDWSNPLATDPTLFSEDIHDITTRLGRQQPLTVNQKITLLQFWLDKLNRDPRSFPVHPALTWTHPRDVGERPGREAPRMEEKFVPAEYDRAEVDRLRLEERRRERRGRMSQYEAERRAYALKVSDVRRAYMAEWRAVKERRDTDILKEWRATKAASAQRRQQRAEAHAADETETEREDEEKYQQALQQRRQRVEVRVRRDELAKKKRAAQLLQLLEQRKVKGVNHSADASWGVRIDETLFAQTNKAVIGFWPSSMGPRVEE